MAQSPTPVASTHGFHTSIVYCRPSSGAALTEIAQRAEALGYNALVIPDAPGSAPSVFPALAWVAATTPSLQVGTHVLNNEIRHPLNVAREAATVHMLSGGRFILGMGTGKDRDGTDIKPFGIAVESPGKRVNRLEAPLGIITDLFAGETVTTNGPDYALDGAELKVSLNGTPTPPLLIAAGGPRMLALGGRVADVVALAMGPMSTFDQLREGCAIVRDAAKTAGRSPAIGFSISGAGDVIHPWLRARLEDQIDEAALADVPSFLMGDAAAITDKLARIRQLGVDRLFIDSGLMEVMAPMLTGAA